MAADTTSFRYSTGQVATSEAAKEFAWEDPVPVNRFWDSFEYCTARNFLGNFSDHELEQAPINPESSDDHRSKLQLLLRLLREKLARQEASVSPPQSLYETNHNQWYALWQGIYEMEQRLDLPEAEQTVRMLAARKPDPNNIVPQHMLADYLVNHGKHKEAEDAEWPVLAWMEARPKLGRESPQAINARRILVQALWGQGPSRRVEAQALVTELTGIVEGMGDGKFKVYQEEERKLNQELLAKLGK